MVLGGAQGYTLGSRQPDSRGHPARGRGLEPDGLLSPFQPEPFCDFMIALWRRGASCSILCRTSLHGAPPYPRVWTGDLQPGVCTLAGQPGSVEMLGCPSTCRWRNPRGGLCLWFAFQNTSNCARVVPTQPSTQLRVLQTLWGCSQPCCLQPRVLEKDLSAPHPLSPGSKEAMTKIFAFWKAIFFPSLLLVSPHLGTNTFLGRK